MKYSVAVPKFSVLTLRHTNPRSEMKRYWGFMQTAISYHTVHRNQSYCMKQSPTVLGANH